MINDIILRRAGLSRYLNSFYAVLLIAIFSGSPVFSAEIDDENDKMITGTLVKVELKTQSIFIKENSRIVKFKASAADCDKFKTKINSEVDVKYKINNNKSLQILSIVISETKE